MFCGDLSGWAWPQKQWTGHGDSCEAKHVRSPGSRHRPRCRLAELVAILSQMSALVRSAARRYDDLAENPDALDSMGFAIEMNALKISASTLVVEIVGRAMTICGMAGTAKTPRSPSGGCCATRTALR